MSKWFYHIPHTTFEEDPEARVSWEDVWLMPETNYEGSGLEDGESFWFTLDGSGMVRRDLCDSDDEYQKELSEFLDRMGDQSYYLNDTGTMSIPFKDFNKKELMGWTLVFLKEMGIEAVEFVEAGYEAFEGSNQHSAEIEICKERIAEIESGEATLSPWEEVKKQIEERLGEDSDDNEE